MLNRQQKGAIFLAVSLFLSLYFLLVHNVSNPFYNDSIMIGHIFDIRSIIILFWISYCAILGTYLLLTDKPENPQHKD